MGARELVDVVGRRFREIRAVTERLVAPLTAEDAQVQAMSDVSPPKWHLAHTTWFFETFVLGSHASHHVFDPMFRTLFNSYYESIGNVFPRPRRGLLSRPGLETVMTYRATVDASMSAWLAGDPDEEALALVELGLHHEMQHQELLLTDIKYNFYASPLRPAYMDVSTRTTTDEPRVPGRSSYCAFPAGLHRIGVETPGKTFAFDNEGPCHRVYLEGFELGARLVTNDEFVAFIEADGYGRPELWLADGWQARQEGQWSAPLYWEREVYGAWRVMTLFGLRPLAMDEPAVHLSYYEADAYARWAGARLPTEAEWEVAATSERVLGAEQGNFLETGILGPRPARQNDSLTQMLGDAWEWTASPYVAYPGYRRAPGALGEYNGKFMCNQMVLRGGSCLSPGRHLRTTYRNFLPPAARWQCAGVRLARNL